MLRAWVALTHAGALGCSSSPAPTYPSLRADTVQSSDARPRPSPDSAIQARRPLVDAQSTSLLPLPHGTEPELPLSELLECLDQHLEPHTFDIVVRAPLGSAGELGHLRLHEVGIEFTLGPTIHPGVQARDCLDAWRQRAALVPPWWQRLADQPASTIDFFLADTYGQGYLLTNIVVGHRPDGCSGSRPKSFSPPAAANRFSDATVSSMTRKMIAERIDDLCTCLRPGADSPKRHFSIDGMICEDGYIPPSSVSISHLTDHALGDCVAERLRPMVSPSRLESVAHWSTTIWIVGDRILSQSMAPAALLERNSESDERRPPTAIKCPPFSSTSPRP